MDVLNAKRYAVKYRNENFYVVVSEKDGTPYEVFAEHATDMDYSIQYMMASVDALTRTISLSLRCVSLGKVVEQLERASRQKNDLPAILANALKGELV